MPLFFVVPIIIAALAYFISKKIGSKANVKKCIGVAVCSFVWASTVYQFVNIARYIDSSGEAISSVLGTGGLYLSWIGIILLSVYLLTLLIDFSRDLVTRK